MRLIGIDYGRKRVGIAVSDENGKFALAHEVWPNDDHLVSKIKNLVSEKNAEAVVIGESRNHDGTENEIMTEIKILKEALETVLPVQIYFEPEFFTSAEAERVQGRNYMHDASAAALILKSYIDRHSSKKNGDN